MTKRGATRGGRNEYSGGMDSGATTVARTLLASERCMADSEGWMERNPQKSRWTRTRGNVIKATLARGKEKVVSPGGERNRNWIKSIGFQQPILAAHSRVRAYKTSIFFSAQPDPPVN